jgi:DNA-binding transcriptional ArsR family regulator
MSKYRIMSIRRENIFKALADSQRRRILYLLRRGELPAGSLADALGLKPATVSHHLAQLRNAELVRMRKDGQHRIYALNVSVVEDAMLTLTELINPQKES